MKMINDLDMYYAHEYAKEVKPLWMKAERMDFCDKTAADRKAALLRFISRKKA